MYITVRLESMEDLQSSRLDLYANAISLHTAMRKQRSTPSIRSLTRSPISFIHALTRSRWLAGGQVAVCSVDCNNFFMYAFNKSESNTGRGDGADERGFDGERSPVGEIMAAGGRTQSSWACTSGPRLTRDG